MPLVGGTPPHETGCGQWVRPASRRSREAGFTAHLTKPIDFAKLKAMIRQVAPTRP